MRRLTVLTALALLTACGGESTSTARPSSTVGLSSTTAARDAAAGEGAAIGSRVDHVVADGLRYEVSCARAEPREIGSPVKLDEDDSRFAGAAEVLGEERRAVLALQVKSDGVPCRDATWVLAFGSLDVVDPATAEEYARRRCNVPATPDDPRCAEGGPFWFGTDPSVDGTEGDGRSAVWVDGRMPEPEWRLDPLEVVAAEVGLEPTAPAFYLLRRVGLRLLQESADRVVVEVLYQDVIDNAGEPLGSEQREHHTLGRLRGRDGWYQSTFIVAQYAGGDVDDATLDAGWAAGIDRVLVDVDRR